MIAAQDLLLEPGHTWWSSLFPPPRKSDKTKKKKGKSKVGVKKKKKGGERSTLFSSLHYTSHSTALLTRRICMVCRKEEDMRVLANQASNPRHPPTPAPYLRDCRSRQHSKDYQLMGFAPALLCSQASTTPNHCATHLLCEPHTVRHAPSPHSSLKEYEYISLSLSRARAR
jgi:hypothetical protein